MNILFAKVISRLQKLSQARLEINIFINYVKRFHMIIGSFNLDLIEPLCYILSRRISNVILNMHFYKKKKRKKKKKKKKLTHLWHEAVEHVTEW